MSSRIEEGEILASAVPPRGKFGEVPLLDFR